MSKEVQDLPAQSSPPTTSQIKTKFPAKQEKNFSLSPPEKKKGPKGKVVVFPDWCKGCGICVFYCPTDTLATAPDGKAMVQNPETCIACMQCDFRCPDYAITVTSIKKDNGGES